MKNCAVLFGLFLFVGCSQSTIVLDPVNNAVTSNSSTTTQSTLTLSVNLTNTNYASQVFSALLFQNGTLMAGITNSGTGTTDASGAASVAMFGVNASGCVTATAATLTNGDYDLYFAINANSAAMTAVKASGCGGSGFIEYTSTDAPGTLRGTVTMSGNTTYNIADPDTNDGKQHTFQFAVANGNGISIASVTCYIVDINITSITATSAPSIQPIGIYIHSTDDGFGNGTTMGDTGKVNLLPVGLYRYFCASGNFTAGNKLASGTLAVNGGNTTYLTLTSFSDTL